METKKYFDLIEKEYLNEVSHVSKKDYIEEAFKMAYLILFFHNSKNDIDGRDLLLGDLFISLLNRHLLILDRELLKKITDRVTLCYSKKITCGKCDYTEELLELLKEVS
ncbi:hypothetical protein [Psychrilyobacter sp.]|uniref:hypothetical protein n=1 Tax=Psychrilyobacter sp. TaxID=2586924 RepID=UPI003018BD2A